MVTLSVKVTATAVGVLQPPETVDVLIVVGEADEELEALQRPLPVSLVVGYRTRGAPALMLMAMLPLESVV